MHPLYPVAAIRQIEQAAQTVLPPGALMQRAGEAAAKLALCLLSATSRDANVLVLAGPGNNGGDALEAASHLAQAGVHITVVLFADPAAYSSDASQALRRAKSCAIEFTEPASFAPDGIRSWSLVIDGLFGIGLARPITGAMHTLVEQVNALACPILALDVPSGLNADNGNIVGPEGIAVRATHTISFIGDKPGLHTCDGRDHAGMVDVASLAIDPMLFPLQGIYLNDPCMFAKAFHARAHNTHKGSFGDIAILGGAHGMSGAPILAARAAAHCGAGRVFVGFVDDAVRYDSAHPELMCRAADALNLSGMTLVAGPGMGVSRKTNDLLARSLKENTTIVLDADALNLIAAEPGLQQKAVQRKAPALMTPHPLEAARLLGITSQEVQADRLQAARTLAARFHAVVILKGSGSVIARPDGTAVINPTGNPALATAGTGDVLAGVCGALLAQGIAPWEAALAAVWLHGRAADMLVAEGIGPIGMVASELPPAIRSALNQLVSQAATGALPG